MARIVRNAIFERQVRILIIEDDCKTARALQQGLNGEGYDALAVNSGEEGLSQVTSAVFDLVILDWMLPGRDGIEILTVMRARAIKPPVLLLTARDAVEDRVHGLDSGADDYLIKPFAFAELLARIRMLLRRSQNETARRQIGDLVVDFASRRTWRGGVEIMLTPREFALIAHLMRYAGQVVTRQMLAQEVWREPNRLTPIDNVIDVHLAHLRKKIDGGQRTSLIQTVRGVGFMLSEEREG